MDIGYTINQSINNFHFICTAPLKQSPHTAWPWLAAEHHCIGQMPITLLHITVAFNLYNGTAPHNSAGQRQAGGKSQAYALLMCSYRHHQRNLWKFTLCPWTCLYRLQMTSCHGNVCALFNQVIQNIPLQLDINYTC